MNKKGSILNNIMIVMILVVVLVLIVGVYSLASIVLPILSGEGMEASRTIQESINQAGISELQNASQVATETTVNALGVFELMVYFGFIGLLIGFILIAYYVRTYPFLAFFWVASMVLIVIMSMIMSNAYEQAKIGELESFYTNWGTNDLLMTYLPHIMTLITIVGGIVLFAIISRDGETETQAL